jgi:hypothetical protein
MTPPTQTEPPFVPLRHGGWATRRTPWWAFAVLVVVVIGVVVVSLAQKPSQSQRASDLEGYFGDVSTGVGSCAAGLQGSESAYDQVLGGDTAQTKTALAIFTYGGSNCTVESNEAFANFANYQVAESLASLNLDAADNDVITWAFDSVAVQTDMTAVVKATPGAARASAQATLKTALGTLDAERSTIDAIWTAAKKSTNSGAAFTKLPTWTPPSS